MEKTIKTEKLPIYSWAKEIEEGALSQTKNLANLPIAYHHIAIMSDVHEGYGMPIGGILAAETAIIPNAVGVDIGCGVRATQTTIQYAQIESHLQRIVSDIARSIPLGFAHHKEAQTSEIFDHLPTSPVIEEEIESAKHQLGTLGGGNHFLEIQKDAKDNIWLMVHSGSRNFGYKTAEYYHKIALSKHGEYEDLAWLEMGDIGREYFDAMNYCIEFARQSRRAMLEKMIEVITKYVPDFEHKVPYDVHHNYASFEEHFGKQVYVHRKGAIRAFADEIGLIPGSMGTPSYVVKGLGNELSFKSCSHGAGRQMSRGSAKRSFHYKELKSQLKEKNIYLSAAHKSQALEEAPGAYKDIEEVIKLQHDLVDIVEKLTPIGVVVG